MFTQDKIEKYKECIIQHGHYSDRIYLMKTGSSPPARLPYELIDLAKTNGYSKIFAKLPENIEKNFLRAGFLEEARIPGFFAGKDAAVFMGFYLDSERMKEPDIDKMKDILKIALAKRSTDKVLSLENRFTLRDCNKSDVSAMAKIYRDVFPSYPFPIHDPDYLLKTMKSHIDYFGIETDGGLVALSSAEEDREASNAEMTDFATLPEWRGNNFGQILLDRMDSTMTKKNINTAYTIARAMSPGMNITFSKSGYKFGGRLKNNTNISGRIESMNVWYKSLDG
ncbi:MAG: putative beta-lysine N-acetyltransferase [Candidatus Auribacterota bacterium]|nr:putative beta-lysine N-acetyltransferase [Candidatus Auribacterota bacterium]